MWLAGVLASGRNHDARIHTLCRTRCRSRGPDARDGRRAASRVAAVAATEAAVATRRHASRSAHRGTAGGRARDHQGAPGPPARVGAATGVPRQSCRHGASVARSHHGRGARRGPGPSRRRRRCAVDLGRRRGAAFRSDRRTARHGHRGRQGCCKCLAAERRGHFRPRRPAIDIARHPGYRQFLVDRPRRRRGGGGLGTGDVRGVPGPCDRLLRLHRRRHRRDLSVRRLRTWHARLRNHRRLGCAVGVGGVPRPGTSGPHRGAEGARQERRGLHERRHSGDRLRCREQVETWHRSPQLVARPPHRRTRSHRSPRAGRRACEPRGDHRGGRSRQLRQEPHHGPARICRDHVPRQRAVGDYRRRGANRRHRLAQRRSNS